MGTRWMSRRGILVLGVCGVLVLCWKFSGRYIVSPAFSSAEVTSFLCKSQIRALQRAG